MPAPNLSIRSAESLLQDLRDSHIDILAARKLKWTTSDPPSLAKLERIITANRAIVSLIEEELARRGLDFVVVLP
jgi:hypothetical protein